MNLAGFLTASARTHGDKPAVIIGQSCYLDYATLARQVAGLGGALLAQGLTKGDRVLLAMSNNPDYLTILFACWQAGLTAVPVNAKLHPREIGYIAQDSASKIVFASPDLADGIAHELPDLPLIVPGTDDFTQMTAHEPIVEAKTEPTDIAWVFYTSGTTGRPKGALLSHRNLSAMAIAYLADVDHLTPPTACCIWPPLRMRQACSRFPLSPRPGPISCRSPVGMTRPR
ncbi:AMP-binding protein [Pararhodobacter sp.]|uniref:AMP-binding protein n=1 Tax=Pararhodobacter sp. TaxID=2127056 RepID=UPI003A59998D